MHFDVRFTKSAFPVFVRLIEYQIQRDSLLLQIPYYFYPRASRFTRISNQLSHSFAIPFHGFFISLAMSLISGGSGDYTGRDEWCRSGLSHESTKKPLSTQRRPKEAQSAQRRKVRRERKNSLFASFSPRSLRLCGLCVEGGMSFTFEGRL